jgi:glycosyltransferase involved in cell wall biosynthesis
VVAAEVLHVSPVFGARSGFGGMATAAEYLCSELAKLGVNVTVITSEATGRFRSDSLARLEWQNDDFFRTVRLPVAGRAFERFTGMYYTPDFRAIYSKLVTTADMVHFHGFRSYQNLAAARITHNRGKKYLLQPHGSATRSYGKGFLKVAYDHVLGSRQARQADALIASTQVEELQLRKMRISPNKIHAIPIGVYKESWARTPKNSTLFRDHFRIARNAPIVLFAGRLDLTKGLDLLVNSFRTVLEGTPSAMLMLVGPDFGMQSNLEAQVQKSGLRNHVVFAGPTSQELLRSAYKESTVVVIPSTYESFGLVALEAAAAGTPVVMTEACGLAMTFRNAGLAVVKADLPSLGGMISRLVRDEDFRNSQRVGLDKLPWEKFTWREVAHAVLVTYENALRG